jgi:hypothetical protein
VVLFGGLLVGGDPSGDQNDTWTWDGASWTRVGPGSAPPARHFASSSTSTPVGVLLFSGVGGASGSLADTWIFDGKGWTKLAPATAPSRRLLGTLAGPVGGHPVLFGGFDQTVDLGDAWTWDGSTWTKGG